MDETTKQRVTVAIVAFNVAVMTVMIGTAFTAWNLSPRILLSVLVGAATGGAAYFLNKGQ